MQTAMYAFSVIKMNKSVYFGKGLFIRFKTIPPKTFHLQDTVKGLNMSVLVRRLVGNPLMFKKLFVQIAKLVKLLAFELRSVIRSNHQLLVRISLLYMLPAL